MESKWMCLNIDWFERKLSKYLGNEVEFNWDIVFDIMVMEF